jgi:MFS family permease
MQANKSFSHYSAILIIFVFIGYFFTVALQMDGMNILLPALEATFGWSRGEITGAVTIGSLLAVIFGYLAGTLILRFNVKKILIPTLLISGFDVIWMANASTLPSFYYSMIILQILMYILMFALNALIANWYVMKRGRVLGIVTISPILGSATFVPGGTKIVEAFGLTFFYNGVGILVLVLAIIGFIFIIDKPEDINLIPDGESINEKEALLENTENNWPLKRILRTKETWLITFGMGLIFLIMTGFMGQLIPRFTDVGIEVNTALTFIAVAALLGMPMSYFWGWMDDKISTPKTCVIFASVYIVASLCFIYVSPGNIIANFGSVLCIALTTGGCLNLMPSIVAYVFGRKEFVNVNRYIVVGHNILRSVAFVIMGVTYDIFGTYTHAYVLFGFTALFALYLLSRIKTTYDPERLKIMGEAN